MALALALVLAFAPVLSLLLLLLLLLSQSLSHGTAWHGVAGRVAACRNTAWRCTARYGATRHGTARHGASQRGREHEHERQTCCCRSMARRERQLNSTKLLIGLPVLALGLALPPLRDRWHRLRVRTSSRPEDAERNGPGFRSARDWSPGMTKRSENHRAQTAGRCCLQSQLQMLLTWWS